MSNLGQLLIKREEQEKIEDEKRELLKSLQELVEINEHLSTYLKTSEEQIETISDNITLATINIDNGTQDLKSAQNYSFKFLPIVIGVSIGFIVGGPFGLIPGFKAGGLATASGLGIVGGLTGYKIQK